MNLEELLVLKEKYTDKKWVQVLALKGILIYV